MATKHHLTATEPLSGRPLSLLRSPVYGLPLFFCHFMFCSVTGIGCLSFIDCFARFSEILSVKSQINKPLIAFHELRQSFVSKNQESIPIGLLAAAGLFCDGIYMSELRMQVCVHDFCPEVG